MVWLGFAIGIALVVLYKVMEHRAPPSPDIVCPHCRAQGTVKVSQVRRKQGLSGGKVTGAVFTGGVSMLATGLSRKTAVNHMRCLNCRVQWDA